MKRLTVLAATAAIMGWTGSASAADVYDNGGSMKDDIPYVAPLPTWRGFYLGVGGGGSVTTHDWTHDGGFFDDSDDDVVDDDLPIFPLFDSLSDNGTVSGFGTVQLGFDGQILGGNWVAGLFADYDWMNLDTDLDGNTISFDDGLVDVGLSVEVDNMWSIGGRFGYLTSPNTLIYGLLAYTQADITAFSDLTLFDGVGGVTASLSESADIEASGITVGAGIETKLAEHVSLKFEYRYTDLDDDIMNSGGFTAPGVLAVSGGELDIDTDIHSVRALLVWRTDWLNRGLGGY
jgi:outer membrane immunogenic protein